MTRPMPRCSFLIRSLGVAAAAIWSASAFAEVDPHALYPQFGDTRIIYYDVSGETPMDVARQIKAHGPVAVDGGRVDAQTHSRLGWELLDEQDGQCIANAWLETTVTLPRLANTQGFTPTEQSSWQLYMWALIDHEFGHVTISHNALASLRAALARGACDGAHERAEEVVALHEWEQIEFDRQTRHGQLTGVKFP